MFVVLDSGPLGLLSNPTAVGQPAEVRDWALEILDRGHTLVVPEICDYEVRRELVRANKADGIRRLDALGAGLAYDALTTQQLRLAAELWADARHRGLPTAPDLALDGDVILAAQARLLDEQVVVATTNATHLGRFVDARHWQDI